MIGENKLGKIWKKIIKNKINNNVIEQKMDPTISKQQTDSETKNKSATETLKTTIYDTNDFLENYQELKLTNQTSRKLSKYDRALIIGTRAQQLASRAPPFIVVPKNVDNVVEIAKLELEARKIPFILKRKLETHDEYWKLEDMIY